MSLIDTSIDMNVYHIYNNNKSILIANNMKDLKNNIKKYINPPNKNKKVYIINFSYNMKKYPLSINCVQFTITPKLSLVMEEDDIGQTVNYSEEELQKFGFKQIHIRKIIKAIKYDLISYEKSHVSITDVLNATK